MGYPGGLGGIYPPGSPNPDAPSSPLTLEQYRFLSSGTFHPPNTTLGYPSFGGKALTPQGQVIDAPAGKANPNALVCLNEDGQVITNALVGTPQVVTQITQQQPAAGPVMTSSFPMFTSLQLAPDAITVAKGQPVQFQLIGVDASGARRTLDPSQGVTWTTNIPGAHLNQSGQLLTDGATVGTYPRGVRAQLGTAEGDADVAVSDPAVVGQPGAAPGTLPAPAALPPGLQPPAPAGTPPGTPPGADLPPDAGDTGTTAPTTTAGLGGGLFSNPLVLGGAVLLGAFLVFGGRRRS